MTRAHLRWDKSMLHHHSRDFFRKCLTAAVIVAAASAVLPAFGGEGMTTFGLAGAGFHGFFGGGLDDPNVAIVDNLSVKALRGGTLLIVR